MPQDNQDMHSSENDGGEEPATAAQKSYISAMAALAHEEVPFELTKAEASKMIEDLQKKTGRTDDNLAPQ